MRLRCDTARPAGAGVAPRICGSATTPPGVGLINTLRCGYDCCCAVKFCTSVSSCKLEGERQHLVATSSVQIGDRDGRSEVVSSNTNDDSNIGCAFGKMRLARTLIRALSQGWENRERGLGLKFFRFVWSACEHCDFIQRQAWAFGPGCKPTPYTHTHTHTHTQRVGVLSKVRLFLCQVH